MTKLKQVRMKSGLSQEELAEKIEIEIDKLRECEEGLISTNDLNLKTLLLLCKILSCFLDDLIDDERVLELLDVYFSNYYVNKFLKEWKIREFEYFRENIKDFKEKLESESDEKKSKYDAEDALLKKHLDAFYISLYKSEPDQSEIDEYKRQMRKIINETQNESLKERYKVLAELIEADEYPF